MLMMFWCVLLLLLYLDRRRKGPVWALCISWLLCSAPLALGLIKYGYFSAYEELKVTLVLSGYVLSYALGAAMSQEPKVASLASSAAHVELGGELDYATALPYARAAWLSGVVGSVCLVLDFWLFKGAGLDDFSALREIQTSGSVSDLARIASVLTWGCLYSYVFALIFRRRLGTARVLLFALPVLGFVLVALFSAGRQATFQILLFSVLTPAAAKSIRVVTERMGRRERAALWAVGMLMIAYMGYVAVARVDQQAGEDKLDLLTQLFDARLISPLEGWLDKLGPFANTTMVEAMVYFSSPIALLSQFMTFSLPPAFGVNSFPFPFRQVEWLTGIKVSEALGAKIEAMGAAGAMPVGWTTGVSTYILDFGYVGAGVFMVLLGLFAERAWQRAKRTGVFHDAVVALVFLVAAVYEPFMPASTETNLLLLLVFSAGARRLQTRKVEAEFRGDVIQDAVAPGGRNAD